MQYIATIIAAMAIAISLGLLIGYATWGARARNLQSQFSRTYEHIRSKSGATVLWPGSHGKPISYNLRSFDGGRTWYSVKYDREWRMTIEGEAESTYPGLLKHIEAMGRFNQATEGGKKIDLADPDTQKMLQEARFTIRKTEANATNTGPLPR